MEGIVNSGLERFKDKNLAKALVWEKINDAYS